MLSRDQGEDLVLLLKERRSPSFIKNVLIDRSSAFSEGSQRSVEKSRELGAEVVEQGSFLHAAGGNISS